MAQIQRKRKWSICVNFEYFHGQEAYQFEFYRVPKLLFDDPAFASVSAQAKLVYALLMDRVSLSEKNNWRDKNDRVYIYYTIESIMKMLDCQNQKAGKLLKELEQAGLIEKIKQGQGKPMRLYVKNFARKKRRKRVWR